MVTEIRAGAYDFLTLSFQSLRIHERIWCDWGRQELRLLNVLSMFSGYLHERVSFHPLIEL
jgi:hypothetical protein